jgi:hypothetical protein
MLHMAMTVHRQSPPKEKRGMGQTISPRDETSHREAVRKIFERSVVDVDQIVVGEIQSEIQSDLQSLLEYRDKQLSSI